MNKDEISQLSKKLHSVAKIEFPKFELPSIPKNGLFMTNENSKILFENNIGSYDIKNDIIILNNGETFKGKVDIIGKNYTLVEGEYKWPSGQIFNGSFLDDNKYKGTLSFKNGNEFYGIFNNENFEGDGKFNWNDNEYIEGNFRKGKINGLGTLKKNNYLLKGNFIDSVLNGKIIEFKVNLNGNVYEFEEFNFINGEFNDKIIKLKKDNNDCVLSGRNYNNAKINPNKRKINITNIELRALNDCFHLINSIIPIIQQPSIPEEGLIVTKEEENYFEFQNGIHANYDENKEEYELVLPNGEKLINGWLENTPQNKYWMEKGKYIWPSGQEYNGSFTEDNKFNSDDAELKYKNDWTYKGQFENGKLNGKGIFEWSNKNKIDSYFSNGKINGIFNIKWGNILLEGNISDSSIIGFEATIDKHLYKIQKIDKTKVEDDLIIDKDKDEYISVSYRIEKNEIILNNLIENKQQFLDILNSNLEFPNIEPFSIQDKVLIEEKCIKEIIFSDGIIYNKETKTLLLPNKEVFKGELKKDENNNNAYLLDEGEYEWPSGQKYIGKFNENNTFKDNEDLKIIFKNKCIYSGKFKNGKPFGKGDIKWDNGDYIIGNYQGGEVFGETNIKKNNIILKGNYINSIINGVIKDINITINQNNYKISNLTINKGIIEEDYLNIEDDENNKTKVQLNDENKKILSEEEYKHFKLNDKNIVSLFKSLSKIRKINLPYYSSPSIPENGLVFPDDIEKHFVNIKFSNNETFKGTIKYNNDRDFLDEGVYEWPFGQKYKGRFRENKFDSEKAELYYKNEWRYIGGFKLGKLQGYGEYENEMGEIIKGNFEQGKMDNNIIIKTKNIYFEGNLKDSINELYIKNFKGKINNSNYEIYDFKINDKNIRFKKDNISFYSEISKGWKLKLIESLLVKATSYNHNFFYNEPYKKESSNENRIKMLKIQDNINSEKISKLSIYYNKLSKENRIIKGEIGRILGVNLDQQLSFNELMYKMKVTNKISKNDAKSLSSKIDYFNKIKELSKNKNYNDIEEREILKICDNKLLKEMENEIHLINQDINNLRKEREIIEKEKNSKEKELKDLNYLYNIINQNYNELKNQKIKIEDDTKLIEQKIKDVKNENDYLDKYLNNIKNNSKKNNKIIISNKIKNLEAENHKILNEINEKQEIINNGNKEKEDLLKRIKEFEDIIKKQKNNK